MDNHKTIAFIGAGNMAGAIIAGLLQNGFSNDHIIACSPNIQQREHFKNLAIRITSDNREAATQADVIVFGVKPFMLKNVCDELKTIIHQKKQLLISIVAGIKTSTITKWIHHEYGPIVRTMPNIASAVGAGVTGLFANAHVDEHQKILAESLFRSVGTTLWMHDENQLDIITAISGSGPAYLFYIFEAMQKAAINLGIDADQAKLLVAQTATGAAKLAMETGESFEQLRHFVTSEKGTTAAAIDIFNAHHTQDIVKDAIHAALKRAKELSQ
ncbi:MAG: pyrroline-5-carboxylate reductase [Gammaproteobacteria bacterium RIFCSPHIGHO2_12_FULL_40_19]|nr:MAG: pyrroline-5-carboxylate reductase [Gammaproteobacteria bacterium RIFCSPHIGHO2_12_FULL_40_19]